MLVLFVILIMVMFVIFFGICKVDVIEYCFGLMFVVVFEFMVKLLVLVVVVGFVLYILFNFSEV